MNLVSIYPLCFFLAVIWFSRVKKLKVLLLLLSFACLCVCLLRTICPQRFSNMGLCHVCSVENWRDWYQISASKGWQEGQREEARLIRLWGHAVTWDAHYQKQLRETNLQLNRTQGFFSKLATVPCKTYPPPRIPLFCDQADWGYQYLCLLCSLTLSLSAEKPLKAGQQ